MKKYFLTAVVWCGLITCLPFPSRANLPDSLETVVQNGAQVIRHQVVPKETLFSVARKYGIGVAKLKKLNPGLTTLQVGQVILIPVAATAAKKEQQPNSVKLPEPGRGVAAAPTGPAIFDAQGNQVHQVDSKQTLYSIARQYGVGIADLKKWNNLPDNNVHYNQTLVVRPMAQNPSVKPPVAPVNPVKPESTGIASSPVVVARPETIQPDITIIRRDDTAQTTAPRETYSRVTESGLAELIGEGKSGNKYLALHKTAPVGSFISVRNLMNNQTVSVRVIGKLPAIGSNEKVVVKISKRAYQRLGAIDNRFLVEVQYEVAEKILSANQ